MDLAGDVPAAILFALPEHRPISSAAARCRSSSRTASSWLVPLGPGATADLLAEMVAVLAYHYDPTRTAAPPSPTSAINDGDFVVAAPARRPFDVRLTAARRREAGIGPSLLLLYLIQMMAYEDWNVDGDLVGLPTLVCNPSVAFAGAGARAALPLPRSGPAGRRGRARAPAWIRDFGRAARRARLSPVGRSLPRRPAAARRSATIRASAGGV